MALRHQIHFILRTLPQNGTDALSNNPGELTSPTLGATLTWGWIKGSSTVVTAVLTGTGGVASASASATAGTTSTAAGNGGASQTTTAGSTAGLGTTSSAAAAATTTKSGTTRLGYNVCAAWAILIVSLVTGQFL
jgi:hypothetical protein